MIDVAKRLEGLARHASTHAAGVVISPRPITDFVPLYKSSKDEITTMYPMTDVEKMGLLKMDFLALTTLTIIDDIIRMLKHHENLALDMDALPLDDEQSYALFSAGLTDGVFQFESSGMKDILRKFKPSSIEHLTALNALYRPGPIGGGMIDDFIKRKHGSKRIEYELPELKTVLAGNVRRHRLPGTGDADCQHHRRLFTWRGGFAAARHGQEEGGGNGRPA